MPEETVVNAEPSFADLRAMLTPAPLKGTPDPATETPAAAAAEQPAEVKTEPDSEPDATQETRERGEDGKFIKPAAKVQDEEAAVPAGVQKRIDKAVRAQRDAERRAQEAEAKLATAGSQPAGKPDTAQPVEAAGRPESSKFETYEAYVEALTDWKIEVKAQARSNAESARAGNAAFEARVAAVKADPDYADYDEVIAEMGTMPISRAMHDAIRESDVGPQLAHYLGLNPEEAARIAKLPPNAGARAMGAIEAQLSKPPAEIKPAAVKPLPRPAKAIGGAAAPHVVDLNDPNLDMAVFKREFRKRLNAGKND